MSRPGPTSAELEFSEPERYELHAGPYYHFEVSRREFVGTLGAGVILSVAAPSAWAQRAGPGAGGRARTLARRLHLGADGTITVFTSKVECGQGSRTQLTQAAAEELQVPLGRVRLVMGDTAGPDDGGTAGSRTTPASVPAIRQAGAAARQLLIDTAAALFKVDARTLSVREGVVGGLPADKTFGYVQLADPQFAGALEKDIAPGMALVPVREWRILGTSASRVGALEIVTGAHRYASDLILPGLVYGRVLRPPAYGAVLMEIDLGPARAMTGVTAVRDGDFVGVTAANSWAAAAALEAIAKTARWRTVPRVGSGGLFAQLRATASARSRPERKGSPEDSMRSAAKALRASYEVAYIQHAPMEPRAAVAEWRGEELTVWTGSQQPARVRQEVAESMRVRPERVRVIVPDVGGGFGGKHSGEVAVEAARLARDAGRPVQVRWTREEEFTWAYFRPAGVIDVAGALDERGRLTAWEQINFNSGASALATPYAVEHTLSEFKTCDQPLRSGSYRALASTANTFARECFMDELAGLAGVDPLEFRLRHLTNDRLRAVLQAAADRFRWAARYRPKWTRQSLGLGLAAGTEKGSYVACCVEVSVQPDRTFRVGRVVQAFECGAIQNPANLKAQAEGCLIMGLGGALMEEIRFADGKVLNPSFGSYRVPRMKDVPSLETVLVDRPDLASVGAGETPIIAIAPAIANAVAHATRTRLRSLPLRGPV